MVKKAPDVHSIRGNSFLGEQYLTFTYYNAISVVIFQGLNDLDVQKQENLCSLCCLAGAVFIFRQPAQHFTAFRP